MKAAVTLALIFFSVTMTAQTRGNTAIPDGLVMQRVWDAWNTLNPVNAARFYDKDAGDVFFDIMPLQYRGWNAYEAGTRNLSSMFRQLNCKVNEARIHRGDVMGWGTSLVHCDAVTPDGRKSPLDLRWTSIWERRGKEWLIVHEHVSAPLPEPGGQGGVRSPRGPKKSSSRK